jgi:hypothetical protein
MAKKIGELYLSDVLHSTAAVHPAPVHSARVDRLAAIRVRFATKLVLTIHSSHIKIPEIAENAGRRVEMPRRSKQKIAMSRPLLKPSFSLFFLI